MATTFITGDRSAGHEYVALVAVEVLSAVQRGDVVATGDNAGVEQIVRELGSFSNVPVTVVDTPMTSEGYSDWDARHQNVTLGEQGVDLSVRVLHGDPHSSRVTKSALEVFSDDVVEVVTPQTTFGL